MFAPSWQLAMYDTTSRFLRTTSPKIYARIKEWRRRTRSRGELNSMPAHLRADIPGNRWEIEAETSKPFWSA